MCCMGLYIIAGSPRSCCYTELGNHCDTLCIPCSCSTRTPVSGVWEQAAPALKYMYYDICRSGNCMGEPMADKRGQNGGSKEQMGLSAHLCSQRKAILRNSTLHEYWGGELSLWSCSGAGQAQGSVSHRGFLWRALLRGFDFKGRTAMQEPEFDIQMLGKNMYFGGVGILKIQLPLVSTKCSIWYMETWWDNWLDCKVESWWSK